MGALPDFQPGQILQLEHKRTRLYAETIQIVPQRQLCWARPLALLILAKGGNWQLDPQQVEHGDLALYDLRQGADLLLPLSLFQTALDTDVIPVLAWLNTPKAQTVGMDAIDSQRKQSVHRHLQDLIRRLCRAHPNVF
jgi:hypothetical protein